MAATGPTVRAQAAMAYDGTRQVAVMFGGQGYTGALGDTWEYGPPYPGDLDADGDVDMADFALFQTCFNGPNRPPRCQ